MSWAGSGTGSYNGTSSTAAVIVGGPLTEVAQFQAAQSAGTTTSVWASPQTWLGLGAAGLVVGIIAGFVVARMVSHGPPRGRTPPGSGPAPPGGRS